MKRDSNARSNDSEVHKHSYRELGPEELRWQADPASLRVQRSDELPLIRAFIDQHRAYEAISIGARMPSRKYHIVVCGAPGSGRRTMVLSLIEEIAKSAPSPGDWAYVYNFRDPNKPRALGLPKGLGRKLAEGMKSLLEELRREIPDVFRSKDYEKRIQPIVRRAESEQQRIFQQLQEFGIKRGFIIQASKAGIMLIPAMNGQAMTPEEFEKLPQEEQMKIAEQREKLAEQIQKYLETIREIQAKTREAINRVNREVVRFIIDEPLKNLQKALAECPDALEYLDQVRTYTIENYNIFLEQQDGPGPMAGRPFIEYEVNLIVDNSELEGAPVIFEPNPTFYNLFGRVEKKAIMGTMYSDLTMIRPGALHRANGGFLVCYMRDLLISPGAYETLKKTLKFEQIAIEDLAEMLGYVPTYGIRPEPIPLKVKVILMGTPYLHALLDYYDDDFAQIFKVRADFDWEMANSPMFRSSMETFVARVARDERLPPFTREAVANFLEEMARWAGSKNKLTGRLGEAADLIREAGYYAIQARASEVKPEHLDLALRGREFRANLYEEKLQQLVEEGQIFIRPTGKRVGVVHGLSVIGYADYTFGTASRITANTFVGQAGVINIEREVELSGPIHEKGVLILSGLLAGKFAQKFPLSLSATITFEQTYSMVEGDSASAAEYFALISELSGVPVRQDLAVTGSINQKGEIQPVGSINEKIEGFFRICNRLGLTGTQGVIIPDANIQNLMLKEEVISAVRAAKFHIYAIRTAEEGIEILTGLPAGEPEDDGDYPEGTVYRKVMKRLEEYRDRLDARGERGPSKREKRGKREKKEPPSPAKDPEH
ncbi:MAG: Lon protease family protein [bacterium JZ-2024 1]